MSFRDFVSTQRPEALETEAVDAPQKPAAPPAASTALAKLPAARKTSSFHSFAAQRSQRAAPASTWMQSAWADEPELDEETRKLKHRQLVIVPEPPPPPRRVFARVAAEAAGLYATVDAEVAVAFLPEGAPVGRVEGGQPSGGRRGAPAAETALRLEHGAGRPDLAPAWQKGFVDVSPARVLVFGDGSVLDVAANARDASRPEILLEGPVLDYLTAPPQRSSARRRPAIGSRRRAAAPPGVKLPLAEAARAGATDAAKAEEGRIAEAGIEEAEE
ncbi:hypothetical protein JL721_12084 [Aureococcus anophagefferens]|nr:hypothetical protein JL721_12084 [Aureococcus anophagefferens]